MTGSSQANIRRVVLQTRRALDCDYRDHASCVIQQRFIRSAAFLSSKTIACYLAMHDEVDTSLVYEQAWAAKKAIYAPVVRSRTRLAFVRVMRDTRLARSAFGLWEPQSGAEISPQALDVVITPLVAFDRFGNRIGMGGGYYDRAFSFLKARCRWLRPKLVGFGFDCQKVEKIVANPWDIQLYRVLSETV